MSQSGDDLLSLADKLSANRAVADAARVGVDPSTTDSDAGSIRHDAFATVAPPFPLMQTIPFVMDPLATAAPQSDKLVVGQQKSVHIASAASRFRILRPHNAGGLGTVSVARDEELGREVALKEIKESFADHPESRRRFIVEHANGFVLGHTRLHESRTSVGSIGFDQAAQRCLSYRSDAIYGLNR